MGSAKAMEKVHGESRDHRMRYVITRVYLNLHMCIYVSTSINIYIYISWSTRSIGWLVGSKSKGQIGGLHLAATGSNHGLAGTPTWSLQDPYLSKGPNSFMPPAAVQFIPSRISALAELVPVQTGPSACSQDGLDECQIWLNQAPAGIERDRAFGHLPSLHWRSQCEISHQNTSSDITISMVLNLQCWRMLDGFFRFDFFGF